MSNPSRATRWVSLALLSTIFLLQTIQSVGQTVLSVTGDQPSGWVVIYNGQGFASSWTQTQSFSNVTVSAELMAFGVPGQTGRAYLTRDLGPGTTAADEVASTSFSFPLEPSDVTLFSGLTLLPGTYYLSMIGDGDSGSGWSSGCPGKVNAAEGVLLGLDYGVQSIAAYLPASSVYSQPTIFMRFKVTVQDQPAPLPPIQVNAALHAFTTPSEVLLTWEAIPGVDHYEVERAGEDRKWQTIAGSVRATQLRDGDYYWVPLYYRVIGITPAGGRLVSETVSAPSPFSGVQLSGISVRPLSESSVAILWEVNHPSLTQPPGGGARALLEVGPSPNELTQVEWTTTFAQAGRHVLTNLVLGSTYWYRLTITGTDGAGFNYLDSFVTQPVPPLRHTVLSVPSQASVWPGLLVEEDTPLAFTLTTDEPHDPPLTFTITKIPSHAVITGASQEFLYTPSPDWDGLDIFEYSATDGLTTISGYVRVSMLPANDPPVALEPLAASVVEDSPMYLPLEGRERDELGPAVGVTGFVIVAGPANGTFQDGLYTPNRDFVGIDHLTYRASDGLATGNIATVRIRVEPANDPPFAQNQTITTPENTPRTISLAAGDVDGPRVYLFILDPPTHGTLSVRGIQYYDPTICHALSDLIYTPNADYFGPDLFNYVISDGSSSAWGTVLIQVIPNNRAPLVSDQSALTESGMAVPIILSGTDPDGDALTYTMVSGPGHGTLSGSGSQLVYTSAPGYVGTDSFSFVANDGQLSSAPASVMIQVLPTNRAPLANGQSALTEFAIALPIVLSGTDPDGDVLTYTIVSAPGHGTLSGIAPQLNYSPDPGYAGSDSFSFTVNDGRLGSAPAWVAITVLSASAPPQGPVNLQATPRSGHRIDLTWTDRSSYEKGFRIERGVDGGALKQIASVNENVTTFMDGGVQANKTYTYRVRAYNKNGDSSASNPVTVTALP